MSRTLARARQMVAKKRDTCDKKENAFIKNFNMDCDWNKVILWFNIYFEELNLKELNCCRDAVENFQFTKWVGVGVWGGVTMATLVFQPVIS